MPDAPDRLPFGATAAATGPRTIRLELEATHASIAEVRRIVRRFLADVSAAGSFTVDRADDVVLAASELSSNAVEHAGAPSFTLSLQETVEEVRLAVHSASAPDLDLARLSRPDALADPTAPRGRGLGIVRVLSDEVDVAIADGLLCVGCRFLRS
jgi:anti-sigma regulatory factor (Ser/Thr protein kinase)